MFLSRFRSHSAPSFISLFLLLALVLLFIPDNANAYRDPLPEWQFGRMTFGDPDVPSPIVADSDGRSRCSVRLEIASRCLKTLVTAWGW